MGRDANDSLHRPLDYCSHGSGRLRPTFARDPGDPGSNIRPHRDSHTGHHPCTQTHAATHSNSDCGYYTRSHSIDNSNPTHSKPAADSDSSSYGHTGHHRPTATRPAPTPTPASTMRPTVTPPPTPTAAPTPTATVAPAVTPPPSPTPTPTPTTAPSAEQPQFSVTIDHATLQFPDSVSFHMEGRSQRPIESVDLEFGINLVFSCASISYWTARADMEPGEDISVTWEWDMRRSGSMPPGSVIWWRWRLTDDEGQEMLTPRRETNFCRCPLRLGFSHGRKRHLPLVCRWGRFRTAHRGRSSHRAGDASTGPGACRPNHSLRI